MRSIPIHSNVQLIGERGDLGSRPLLFDDLGKFTEGPLFEVVGNDVRIEGLHLRGPEGGSRSEKLSDTTGVQVDQDPVNKLGRRVVIADNELDEWAEAGVRVQGTVDCLEPPPKGAKPKCVTDFTPPVLIDYTAENEHDYDGPVMQPGDVGLIRVERNYLHNNARLDGGYGVVVSGSAYATVEGNVFNYERHHITSSGHAFTGYDARFNYALEGGFFYAKAYWGPHFDVHGIGTPTSRMNGHYDGYSAGTTFHITNNTFRGEQSKHQSYTRPAFVLRGRPEIGAQFANNVVVHDNRAEAILLKSGPDKSLKTGNPRTFNLKVENNNRYNTDYTRDIAVGDFDGDRRSDVFLANGTAWFLSRAGFRPWEFLRASSEAPSRLALADIDNDGVTDIISRDGGQLRYSRGGVGSPVPLRVSLPVSIDELRFGDFDADGKTDMFYTRDKQWHVWHGREGRWEDAASSDVPVDRLLFGEFDGVKGTDVAAVRDDAWSFSSGATHRWQKLNRKLAKSFADAVAADFDGNGRSDIAFGSGKRWQVSYDGHGDLRTLRTGEAVSTPLRKLLIGRFDGGASHDQVLGFDNPGLNFNIWRGGASSYVRQSTQQMR